MPKKNKIKETYQSYVPLLTQIMSCIESKLKLTLQLNSRPTYKSRIKSFNSYYRKVLRLKAEEAEVSKSLVPLTDMMGIRVICAFLEDLHEIEEQIKVHFDVKEVEYKGAENNFREFGYESIHVLIAVPPDCMPKELPLPLPKDIVAEIQIRTILQDAWAEVEHELIYKTEFSPFDMPLRRKLASMNASLTLADITFQEIRDYQKKLQKEVEDRRSTFYGKVDSITNDLVPETIPTKKAESINRVSPYVHGTIDDMILEAIHTHNQGEYDKAISIYSQIISAVPAPSAPVMAVIHKHRGMAYFAKGNYENSLEDFKASVSFDPKAFRAYYYIGIVYNVMGDHKQAIENYNKSAEINEFQSHVYYRRAISYFQLDDYEKALSDLDYAQNLGLQDPGAAGLREKIVAKLGLGM